LINEKRPTQELIASSTHYLNDFIAETAKEDEESPVKTMP
jgi:hypothetical protein